MKKLKKLVIAAAVTAFSLVPIMSAHSFTLIEIVMKCDPEKDDNCETKISNHDSSVTFKFKDDSGITYTGNFDFSEGRISQDASGKYYYTVMPISITAESPAR